MRLSRRSFLHTCGAAGFTAYYAAANRAYAQEGHPYHRRYHASISIDALDADPELAPALEDAGVTDVWLACLFSGQWHQSVEAAMAWRDRLAARGMATHQITIPLGHPTYTETPPNYMPNVKLTQWKHGMRPDGTQYYGVSLHEPATAENVAGLQKLKACDPGIVFVDDDFRLAPSPDDIGGCYCPEHRDAFLKRHGYGEEVWRDLIEAVNRRDDTPLLRAWLSDTCDELTACFRAQQAALAPQAKLGIMVMYMGSEKAGIRLTDYAGVPMRVGELMFDDASFAPTKGKTNELFSSLFHRRFTTPELAFSETTAWPPDKLSAANMAAKLAVSTISDVRNTMFMSGLTPFPRSHWPAMKPTMKAQAQAHRILEGHVPQGPFKHFWGESSRLVNDSNSFSLFLATGIPFEVISEIGDNGWVFLANADAKALERGMLKPRGATCIVRPDTGIAETAPVRLIPESLEDLFALKHEIIPTLTNTPYILEDIPIVCAWYPTAQAVYCWNLTEQPQTVTLCAGAIRRTINLTALGCELITELNA